MRDPVVSISMGRLRDSRQGGWLRMLAVVATATLAFGCAAPTPAPPPDLKSQLAAAGFKVVPATTRAQQEHLQTLAPGQVTEWQRTGRTYFVYPDASRNRLYVGTQKEYDRFRRLVPGAGGPTPAQQTAADMAAYNKQDAAIRRAQGDTMDPYAVWTSFDDLGW
ncbi:MAG TPA: hypothetical protein VMN79_10300 [Casimicrobiaceae bacterium]|nr:hypothetical protein [Casimicrobiaceae bacterium]